MILLTSQVATARLKQWVRGHGQLLGSVTGTTSDAVVLTLDDGPDEIETPKMLAVLASHNASATFFVLVGRARRHPALLRAIRDGGHEIALHGPDHRSLTTFGFTAALRRTRSAKAELESLSGMTIRWFRPPYGSQTPTTWLAVRASGLVPVLWDSTTWDWKDVTPDQRMAKALAGARPGAVLLAHDGIAGADDGVAAGPPPLLERARLLDTVLDEHMRRGLRGRSLGAALEQGTAVRTAQFTGIRRTKQADALTGDKMGPRDEI